MVSAICVHRFPSTQRGTRSDQGPAGPQLSSCASLGWVIGSSSRQLLTQGEEDLASGLWALGTEAS